MDGKPASQTKAVRIGLDWRIYCIIVLRLSPFRNQSNRCTLLATYFVRQCSAFVRAEGGPMKPRSLFSIAIAFFFLLTAITPIFTAEAQSGRPRETDPNRPRLEPRPIEPPSQTGQKPAGTQSPQKGEEAGDTIKIDTTIVTIPVSVLDRTGKFVANLQKRDFKIFEDNVAQEITNFSSVEVPFNVVLLIDTSRSTAFRMEDIQRAAASFTEQLRPDDKVMVVSFDDKVYVDCEFTNDRTRLRRAIYGTRTGGGTKLYDAVDLVLTERLEHVDGRKAIVLFSDGVDTTSKYANAPSTLDLVEESGVLVYPIRYETETQYRAGGGNNRGNRGPTIINPFPFPIPFPIPLPTPRQGGRRYPLVDPAGQFPRGGSPEDYRVGAQYMQDLADRSGARLYDADTLMNLDRAFTQVAEELRHQYSLSYYPTNAARDGSYRRIRVRVMRPNLAVRTRDGYRAEDANPTSANGTQRDERNRPKLRPRN